MTLLLMPGCESLSPNKTKQGIPRGHLVQLAEPSGSEGGSAASGYKLADADQDQAEAEKSTQLLPGTGKFLNTQKQRSPGKKSGTGNITLNFESTDIREVVKVILGDTLKLGYILDPNVQGVATLQTGRPLSLDDLMPTLEMLLRMNGAAMIETDGGYHIIPISNAARGNMTPQLGESNRPLPYGYSVRIVPLKYIGVAEMAKILTPFSADGSIIRVDTVRNLLVLAGTGKEMKHLLDTIHLFDVDWIKGLSVGFYTLKHTKADSVIKKLNTLFGDDSEGALSGMLRVVPIDDANGLLVVTPQKEYLETARVWIERLDQIGADDGSGEQQLYVYRVQNSDASKLAELLSELFDVESKGDSRLPEVAPGLAATKLTSKTYEKKSDKPGTTAKLSNKTRSKRDGSTAGAYTPGVRIVADAERNSLLVTAAPRQYAKILDALKELDTIPLQVLVEATIMEVALEGNLKYGLQWFFKSEHGSGSAVGELNIPGSSPASLFPGFNFSLLSGSGDVKAVFSALAKDSLVRVLSSPSVTVLNNHTARIQVGDQVPIATQQQQSTEGTSNLINSIQYRDTGVVLEVTPRVNPGGLVIMDVSQEVSDVATTDSSELDSPTIRTRKINSSIAVQSGEAMVLGGLIKDTDEDGSSGVPGLHDIPVIGFLFGQKAQLSKRTELVVVLIPTVIKDSSDARKVVESFRNRLEGLRGSF